MVPVSKVKPLTNVSAGEAMKFAVSGGVTNIEVHEKKEVHA
jgi:uncharacterized membrane protein